MPTAGEHPVVALCGSVRFGDAFKRLEVSLTLSGHVVLAPVALDPSVELSPSDRERLGRLHLQRVAMADEVVVVDVGGYVGESTRREIAHALSLGIPVSYLEPLAD